jgi:Fe-S-cluster containining protein
VSLGPLITIERQLNDQDYYCRCKIDNAIFVAHVDPAYREDIADTYSDGDCGHSCGGNRSCPFLRHREGGGSICAIYHSRPNICRDFRCYHMLIRNNQGMICGRVIGKNTLRTEDFVLRRIWDEEVVPVSCGDMVAWRKKTAGILVRYAYSIDQVE